MLSISLFFFFTLAWLSVHFKGVQGVAVSARLRLCVLSSAVEACTR